MRYWRGRLGGRPSSSLGSKVAPPHATLPYLPVVPWHDRLSAADKLALAGRYPGRSFDEIAILATEHPRYGQLFDEFEVTVVRSPDELDLPEFDFVEWHRFPEVSFQGNAQAFRELVAQVMLADDEPGGDSFEDDDFLGGEPYSRDDYETAAKLHRVERLSVRGIKGRTELGSTRAARLCKQFREGAVVPDDANGFRPGSGYRFEAVGTDPPRFRLTRR